MADSRPRKKIMWEMDIAIDEGTYAKLRELGLAAIKDDPKALVSYAVEKILTEYLRGYRDGCREARGKIRGKRG